MSNLTLVRALVAAKIAYWDALRAFEVAAAPDGEFSDCANDAVIHHIECLAAGCDDLTQITGEHATQLTILANI